MYQQWKAYENPFNAIAEVTKNAEGKDANAMVFLKSGSGNFYTQLVSDPTSDYFTEVVFGNKNDVIPDNGVNEWRLYNGASILVLSEQAWVNLKEDGWFKSPGGTLTNSGLVYLNSQREIEGKNVNLINAIKENGGSYHLYSFGYESATANPGYELKDVRLVDGTGWSAL